jgi:hypothetical protein
VQVLSIIYEFGDTAVLFSDHVSKINRCASLPLFFLLSTLCLPQYRLVRVTIQMLSLVGATRNKIES